MVNPSQPRMNPRGHAPAAAARPAAQAAAVSNGGQLLALVASWAAVGLPLAWGVLETLRKAMALFH